jgi:excisionase family DNA binding protein
MSDVSNSTQTKLVLSLAEAAAALGICGRSLKREVDHGRLRAFKIGRQWRVRVSEIDAYTKRLEAEFARPDTA